MTVMTFDGSFEGLLSLIFDSYAHKKRPDEIVRDGSILPMFCDDVINIITDEKKSDRVWTAVSKKLSSQASSAVVTSFLCESPDFDMPLFRFLCRTIDSPKSIENDFGDPDVLELYRMVKRVRFEAMNIVKFTRFQKTSDGIYFSISEPRYNVLPVAVNHFIDRFSTMKFVMYDKVRSFGFFYDTVKTVRITLPDELPHIAHGHLDEEIMAEDEKLFQQLWRSYVKAIAIKERANPRKQKQDMPVRFWKYLTEMNG